MKLLLENWRKFLNEEEGEGMLLYHATCFPPEAFVGGIDPTRAKGYGQGEGFYFWTKKENAIRHGKQLVDPESGTSKEVGCPPEPQPPKAVIVISDEPVTPENFDIDYEAYAGGFVEFVVNNKEYFDPRKEDFAIVKIRDNGIAFYSERGSRISANVGSDVTANRAPLISKMAEKLQQEDPEMFNQFEKLILSQSTAVKYNGTEKLVPLRIEDLEGNVIWSR